jgi:hypothetical protein
MKRNTTAKSSFTLPPDEHARVLRLKRMLGARSNTDVIRRSLRVLEETVSRDALRARFRDAAKKVRRMTTEELRALDAVSGDGLDGE